MLPKNILSKMTRALVEFDMIDDGDKILIGLSGGKDSLVLTYALAMMKKFLAKNFSLVAVTIDPSFDENFKVNAAKLADFCNALDIEHKLHAVDIAEVIAAQKKNPCYTCAYFRRAAINRIANELGANKVAYAHHLDDAVETFFMSLLSSGQLTTLPPKTFLTRSKVTVIRPLIYLREYEVSSFVKKNNFEVLKSPCPIDGTTNRQVIKELIKNLGKTFPDLFDHLTAAMRKSSIGELWEAPKSRQQMRETYFSYVHKTLNDN